MRTLGNFTVTGLVDATGVSPQTIRTILYRHEYLLEKIGNIETGRPGGQFTHYRVRDAKALDELLKPYKVELALPPWYHSDVPDALLTAEDTLTRRIAEEAETPERRAFLLKIAAAELDTAEAEIASNRLLDKKSAGAKLEELRARLNSLQPISVAPTVSQEVAVEMSKFMSQKAETIAANADVYPNSEELHPAQLQTAQEFRKEFSSSIPSNYRHLAELAERLNLECDWFMLTESDLPYFGSAANLYAPGVLHQASKTAVPEPTSDSPKSGVLRLRIFIPKFLKSIRFCSEHQHDLAPLERAICEKVAAETGSVETVGHGSGVANWEFQPSAIDIYSPFVHAHY